MIEYHQSVNSGLQSTSLIARKSAYLARIDAPLDKALDIAQRQVKRHPSIGASVRHLSVLRGYGCEAVQLLIMPPHEAQITMFLFSNSIPEASREQWINWRDVKTPLHWRSYQLTLLNQRVTWTLIKEKKDAYMQQIRRTITGRSGPPNLGEKPYQLSPETAAKQIENLFAHLIRYPLFAGIRAVIKELQKKGNNHLAIYISKRAFALVSKNSLSAFH